jgi:branched-chain amino acid transport system permease protein
METAYRISIGGRFGRLTALGGAAILALFVSLPAFAGRATIEDLIFVFYMLALAQYWNLLAGYAGLISVGQQAFVGLGGYMLFALTVMAGLDPLIAIVLAGVIAGLLALPTAVVVFRLNGAYFAIGTWPPSPRWGSRRRGARRTSASPTRPPTCAAAGRARRRARS